jgi:hypothetical protein
VKSELILKSLQLEGELFKLDMKLDAEINLNDYCRIMKQKEKVKLEIEQYKNCLEALERQEKIKSVKRKMLR